MSEANNLKYSPFLIENELLDIFQKDSICNMLVIIVWCVKNVN